MWFVHPSASSSDSDNLVFTRSWDFDGVVSGVGRKWKRSDSSGSYSVALMTLLTTLIFLFSQGHKRSYHSAYDSYSDSVARENQPRKNHVLFTWRQPRKTGRKVRKHSSISGAAVYVFRFSRFINSKALWYTRMFSIVLSLCSRCNYFCKPTHLTFERGFVFSSKREWSRCSSFLVSEKLRFESAFA